MLGVHHAGRTVRDMEASLGFYRDLMGFQVDDDEILEGEDIARFIGRKEARFRAVMLSMDGGPPFIELAQFLDRAAAAGPGEIVRDLVDGHISILVDDIQVAFDRLSSAGVTFNSAPMPITEGAFAGQWVASCLDPDGGMVELWHVPEGDGP